MIACPQCRNVLPASLVNTGQTNPCPHCSTRLRVDLFNACFQVPTGLAGAAVTAHGQAECFYHPGKQAVAPCAGCGRLLCALCDVEFEGRHLCLACLQAGRDKKKITALENRRFLYDSLALALALYPMFFVFPTLVTAPAAAYVSLRYWRHPRSLVPRTRVRFYAALFLAGLQITGWSLFFVRLIG